MNIEQEKCYKLDWEVIEALLHKYEYAFVTNLVDRSAEVQAFLDKGYLNKSLHQAYKVTNMVFTDSESNIADSDEKYPVNNLDATFEIDKTKPMNNFATVELGKV